MSLLLILPLAAVGDEGISHEQADAILKELRQIRALLEKSPASAARPAPAMERAKMKIGEGPFLGSADAPLTLVEFADYQCPYCRQFNLTTFEQLRKNYIETGKLRFVTRDLPLEFHSNAQRAALAARCGGDQGEFWEMRDMLIANASSLAPASLVNYAESLHLDMARFQACMDSEKYKAEIQKDSELADSLSIGGTPSFILGKTTSEGVDGIKIVGAVPYGTFDASLKDLLAGQ